MSKFEHLKDFEVDGNLGRCLVCPASNWTKLKHLREHEKTPRHRTTANQVALTKSSNPPTVNSKHATVEDYFDDDTDDFEFIADTGGVAEEGYRSGSGALPAQDYDSFLDDLITLVHNESLQSGADLAGTELPPAEAEELLQQALNGIDVIDAALWPDDDEAPDEDNDDSDEADERGGIGQSIHQEQSMSAQDIAESHFGAGRGLNEDYFPYPNHAMMKTDILFSSPRLRFSRAQQEAVLAYAKELGAHNIPSLYALNKFQTESKQALGDPTVKVELPSGNIMYMNDPTKLLERMYSHLPTRKLLHSLPELTPNKLKEVWQGSKWLTDVPDDVLNPMIRLRNKDFYIHELTYCSDGQWFIPERYFEHKDQPYAMGRAVKPSPAGLSVSGDQTARECGTFVNNWPEISESNTGKELFAPASKQYADQMPNPDREIAQGLEWECPPIILFIDDVSGNSTKQWNVHYSSYMSHGGLPRTEIEKERNVHFVATSPHASPMEILHAICEAIKKTGGKTPLKVWDALRMRYILIRPWLLFLPGDNPMQSEACSHIGLSANQICRCCHARGTQEYKRSDAGFASMMEPGRPRRTEETRNSVLSQLILATHAGADVPVKEAITMSGVKDSFAINIIHKLIALGKVLRRSTITRKALSPEAVNQILTEELKKYKNKVVINPLLSMPGFEVHKDTPVEPLHTHLLGIVKYFWAQTVWVLDKKKTFVAFQARLNSIDQAGLNISNILADYMCHYRGSLIGKHFKTISQVMVFAIAGLVPDDLCNAWLAVSRLTVLMWQTDIEDVELYQGLLLGAIEDVQDFAAARSPSMLLTKTKIHIVRHLPEHIYRFGPAPLLSTERYEAFNRVFRLCSIHSNRQSPSRDIAMAFANLDRCRHIMTGGGWFDAQHNTWVHAGPDVLRHLNTHAIDARLLGVTPEHITPAGTVTPVSLGTSDSDTNRRVRALPKPWTDTLVGSLCPQHSPEAGLWQEGRRIVTTCGDFAIVGNEVLVSIEGGTYSPLVFGSVVSILSPAQDMHERGAASHSDQREPFVLVKLSILEPTTHPQLKMPVLARAGEYAVVHSKDLLCVANVQHDCFRGGCTASGLKRLVQERQVTLHSKAVVEHKDNLRYIVNMHSLHNQDAIRRALPVHLCARPTFYADRSALHRAAAASLRDQKLQKKLAREATIRKQAEDARRTFAPADEIALIGEDITEHSLDYIVDNEPPVAASVTVQPRGPRGRTAMRQGHGRGNAQGGHQARQSPQNVVVDQSSGTGQEKASNSSHDGAPGLESIAERAGLDATDSGPHPVRKRKRAGANPDEASRREQEVRELFTV